MSRKKSTKSAKTSSRKSSGSSSRSRSASSGSSRRSISHQGYGGWFDDSEGHAEAGRQSHGGRSVSPAGRSHSSRYEEDGDYGRSNRGTSHRGHGGWYGDSEGHSQAAREGHGGWFGDSEGHSEAARRGWQEGHEGSSRSSRYEEDGEGYGRRSSSRSHGHGGWYGDSEGHSEAARRGRHSLSNRDYEDEDENYGSRGRRSSSRYEEDENEGYGRSGRGHGGWYGDSEGHSQAARRR